MAASNANTSEPNETTTLLRKDATKASDNSLSANGSSLRGVAGEGETDVESGTVDTSEGEAEGEAEGDDDNPALKRREGTKMGLLIPAVAIGVCFL
jgi:hypothetical protein